MMLATLRFWASLAFGLRLDLDTTVTKLNQKSLRYGSNGYSLYMTVRVQWNYGACSILPTQF